MKGISLSEGSTLIVALVVFGIFIALILVTGGPTETFNMIANAWGTLMVTLSAIFRGAIR